MSNIAVMKETAIARPLKILTPLIQQDFDAAEQVSMGYYKKAGEKLIEAREGHFDGNSSGFFEWAEKTFKKKREQIRTYMASVEIVGSKSFKTLDKVKQAAGMRPEREYSGFIRRDWTAPVDDIAQKAQKEARRLSDELSGRKQREAEAKLGLRMIEIGYKVLAKELHPDKLGGNREAMVLLNRARDRLKSCV